MEQMSQYRPMTEAEQLSQKQLQARINQKLDREKAYRETHPGEQIEPMYDCSLGMSKILESISRAALLRDDRRQTFDVLLINGLTIVRNCYDKKNSNLQILRNIKKDVNLLVNYIQTYFSDQGNMVEKPLVLVYLPIYQLGDTHTRPDTEERKKIKELGTLFFHKFCQVTPNIQNLHGCTLVTVKVGSQTLPHKDLTVLLDRWNKELKHPLQRRYLLISHLPMDFHLQNSLGNRLYILESYTGKIKSINDLGEKVWKETFLPFNQYTHLLFGDKVLVKPLVMRNDKKKMYEIAQKKRWVSRPLSLILSDIKNSGLISIDSITKLKF